MSYINIIKRVNKINAGIDGIRQTYDYEPMTPTTPCLYTMLSSIPTLDQLPNQQFIVYDIAMRLLVRYSDVETAEELITSFIDKVIVRYHTALKLDGLLVNGSARIVSIRAFYIYVGAVIYRAVEFALRVEERTEVTFLE